MIDAIINLARPEIIAMNAYSSARSEQNIGKIWLDANENPWDNDEGEFYNRYPDPQPAAILKRVAEIYGIPADHILISRGSDEAIDLLTRVFCHAGQDHILICPPTYGMYEVSATIQNAGVTAIPLLKEQNFALDTELLLSSWQPRIKLIFLCSPDNPTGISLSVVDILKICEKLMGKAIVVVDEAYVEFSDQDSLSQYIQQYPNLVILRTLSKAYGLAGVRCGFTLANPTIIQLMRKVIAPYPLPRPVVKIILQNLNAVGVEKVKNQIKIINLEKNKLFDFLDEQKFVKRVWRSDTNFILFEVENAKKVMETCQARGVVIRNRSHEYDLGNCVRATVATPAENQLLMEALAHV